MHRSLVSIVIPSYNAARYVGDAIESALSQTYSHKEVIVIDDGSTDGSLDVVRGFGDRIRWESGPNRGACAARNRGLELAKGELIQFLDADDWLYPRKLELQVGESLSDKRVVVYSAADIGQADGSTRLNAPVDTWDDPIIFTIDAWVQTAAPIHRKRDLLEVGGFRESLPCSQERDLHIRLALKSYSFRLLSPQPLYCTRYVENSLSRQSWGRVLKQRFEIFQFVCRELGESGALTATRRLVLSRVFAKDARSCMHLGLVEEAVRRYDFARQLHRSGGIDAAYPNRVQQILHQICGPRFVSCLSGWRRRLFNRASKGETHRPGIPEAQDTEKPGQLCRTNGGI